jgi:SNF2 family DNA or RNA helicase
MVLLSSTASYMCSSFSQLTVFDEDRHQIGRLLYEGNTEWAPVFNDKGGRSSTDSLVQLVERKSQRSLLSTWSNVWGHAPVAQPYALATALTDSGKLRAMDQLLKRLKAEGHRVLIFSQVRARRFASP